MALQPYLTQADIKASMSDEDSDDSETYEYDPEITLRSIVKSKTINFSISSTYTNWAPREAFRELVQNWRDGIISSFGMQERDFRVTRQEHTSDRNTEIVYKAARANDPLGQEQWLGYIRYKGRDGEGTIDMVNCKAMLEPWHLDMGGTSKAHDEQQAGTHGEGLKVALLVLMRGQQNHSIRCRSGYRIHCRSGDSIRSRSGAFNWTFNFTTRGRLVARLHRMTDEAVARAVSQGERLVHRTLLPLVAEPDRDVQFVIGEARRGRDEHGLPTKRSGIKQAQFEAWTKAALFLYHDNAGNGGGGGNGALLPTLSGDLILAPALSGTIYLKGLLLSESTPARSASMTSLPLRYGYNFVSGRTNRDRMSVASGGEEARAIMAIWDEAMDHNQDFVARMSDMLNSTNEPAYADIAGAKTYMPRRSAVRLLHYLLHSDPLDPKWYYTAEEKSKNPRLMHVIQSLGCTGVQLTATYWYILRKYDLVHTAEDEELRRFTAAAEATIPDTAFATSLQRLLHACFRACPQTDGISLQFVEAQQLDLQLSYSEDECLFRINDRWLSAEGARAELDLVGMQSGADILYLAVKSLFADALEQLPLELFTVQDDGEHSQTQRTPERWRKLAISLAEQRLLNYLMVEKMSVEPVPGRPALRVTWPVDSHRDDDTEIEIQCHLASRCGHLRDAVHTRKDVANMPCLSGMSNGSTNKDANDENTSCCSTRNPARNGTYIEGALKYGVEYFFLVSLVPTDPGALVHVSGNHRCSLPPRVLPSVAGRSPGPVHIALLDTADTANTANNDGDDYPMPFLENSLSPLPTVTGVQSSSAGPLGEPLGQVNIVNVDRWHPLLLGGRAVPDVVVATMKKGIVNVTSKDKPAATPPTLKRQRTEIVDE
ncbi:hypothetical protein SCUCBS95973_002332 [Sporothrix curviconia]|uniref:Uncharacterized protein n=1 Tax=Sporothrix curviconia TaxID=1260050 RepID=A0ABP0B726_9PEZI